MGKIQGQISAGGTSINDIPSIETTVSGTEKVSTATEKYIGESKLSTQPTKKLSLVLKDGSVTTPKIADKAVTAAKIADNVGTEIVQPVIDAAVENLQNQIASLGSASGYVLSTQFGNNTLIGICQKTLTEAVNRIWEMLDLMVTVDDDEEAETLKRYSISIAPTELQSLEDNTVTVTVNHGEISDIIEHISIYLDGTLVTEAENVEDFTYDVTVNTSGQITCVITVLGEEYLETRNITRVTGFWLGAGQSYSDVMTNDNIRSLSESLKGNYDITCEDGDYIIIVFDSSSIGNFVRADLSGVEIPFVHSTITEGDTVYHVLTSMNSYNVGTYNIDINS